MERERSDGQPDEGKDNCADARGRMGWRLNQKDLFLRFPGCFGSVALRREIYSVSKQ